VTPGAAAVIGQGRTGTASTIARETTRLSSRRRIAVLRILQGLGIRDSGRE
jgi:hypothetical protein